MNTFTDNAGRTWTIAISFDAIRRVGALTGVNLVGIYNGRAVQICESLASNPVLLVNVLYAVCQPQAEASGISDEQFGQALAGDVIDGATKALLAELVGKLTPGPKRKKLQEALARIDRAINAESLYGSRGH